VADSETIEVEYDDPLSLMRELGAMGEGNLVRERRPGWHAARPCCARPRSTPSACPAVGPDRGKLRGAVPARWAPQCFAAQAASSRIGGAATGRRAGGNRTECRRESGTQLSAPTVKLSFGETLSESFEYFFRNFRLFFHLVTIPWILSIALGLLGTMLDDRSPAVLLAGKALDMLPTTMFIRRLDEDRIAGTRSGGPLPGLHWSARETAFLIHLLKVAGTLSCCSAPLSCGRHARPISMREAALDPENARRQALALPFATSFIISALLALRVSFGLAASAVDVPFAPRQSWVYSRGNVGRSWACCS